MRTARIFLTLYAVSFTVVSVGQVRQIISTDLLWSVLSSAILFYLAALSWRTPTLSNPLGKLYFHALFWAGCAIGVSMTIEGWLEESHSVRDWRMLALILTLGACWIFACTRAADSLASRFYSGAGAVQRRWQRNLLLACITLGALTQVASLSFGIAYGSEGAGWNVVWGGEPWITGVFNLATPLFFGRSIRWLASIFGPTGRALYIVGILSSIALLCLLATSKGNLDKVFANRFFRPISGLQIIFCGYLVADLAWAVAGLSERPALATLATLCWLGGILFVIGIGRGIASSRAQAWHFAFLIAFLTPFVFYQIALIGLMLLAGLSGLIALDAGALLSATCCLILLSNGTPQRQKQDSGVTVAAAG